jgi:hypothetical protein
MFKLFFLFSIRKILTNATDEGEKKWREEYLSCELELILIFSESFCQYVICIRSVRLRKNRNREELPRTWYTKRVIAFIWFIWLRSWVSSWFAVDTRWRENTIQIFTKHHSALLCFYTACCARVCVCQVIKMSRFLSVIIIERKKRTNRGNVLILVCTESVAICNDSLKI